MFTSQVVKDMAGQHYIIRLRNQGQTNLSLNPEKFLNTQLSYQFVCRLQTPFGLWQNIAASNSFFSLQRWQNSNPSLTIEHYAAQVLVQGFVEVYKAENLHIMNQNSAKTRFKDSAGRTFQLQPVVSLLLTNSVDKKSIHSEREATQFIHQLNLSPEALVELNQTFNLSSSGDASDVLTDAIVSGEIVITSVSEVHKPQVTTEYVEQAPQQLSEPVPATQSPSAQPAEVSNERAENASADALMSAAEEGSPFCEECEKAKNAA